MTLLVDECRWPWRGRRWCHLVSDTDLAELHRLARRLALPRRAFQGDHYDLHEDLRTAALALGALPVASRELVARLQASGLRLAPSARRRLVVDGPAVRLDPAEWVGRAVRVVVDRPLGSLHPYAGVPYPVNVGYLPGTVALDGEPLDAYLLGPRGAVEAAEGSVAAVVRRHDDVEDKLVVTAGATWSMAAIAAAIEFQERWFSSTLLTSAT